jgi:single-strand DNA-binding protein
LAVNRKYKAGEEWKEEVCFVDITVWGKQAENCAEYLSKGRPVFIEGRLQFSTWETDDGQKRNKLEVVANTVQFLGQAGGGGKPGMQPDMEDAPVKDDIPF